MNGRAWVVKDTRCLKIDRRKPKGKGISLPEGKHMKGLLLREGSSQTTAEEMMKGGIATSREDLDRQVLRKRVKQIKEL